MIQLNQQKQNTTPFAPLFSQYLVASCAPLEVIPWFEQFEQFEFRTAATPLSSSRRRLSENELGTHLHENSLSCSFLDAHEGMHQAAVELPCLCAGAPLEKQLGDRQRRLVHLVLLVLSSVIHHIVTLCMATFQLLWHAWCWCLWCQVAPTAAAPTTRLPPNTYRTISNPSLCPVPFGVKNIELSLWLTSNFLEVTR